MTGLPIRRTKFSQFPPAPQTKPKVAARALPASGTKVEAAPVAKPASAARMPVAKPAEPEKLADTRGRNEGSLVGRVIGDKYGVNALIGEGGMGAVYEAEHLTIGRLVALKVLHPANAKRSDAVQRFHHEARAAGTIGHPNICEIYDVGKLPDGTPYLVMERLHGESLADRIAREGALPVVDVIDVLVQVLSALAAAHAKGVIHRDIKPENIFLSTRGGQPSGIKLLDFGISKVGNTDEDLHLTRTGMVMGTPFYMAPEQARGDRTIDQRIDLYAAGAVLYESLTGRRPFTAPNYNALLVQILSGTPRPLRELRPALPHGFEPIVEKALAKNRELRFQTAAEFLDALARLKEEVTRGPDPRDLVKAAEKMRSDRPPRRASSKPPPNSVEIPVFTGSGPYMSVASAELMAGNSLIDTDPNATAPDPPQDRRTESDIPVTLSRDPVADTYVDSLADGAEDWQDATEIGQGPFSDGNTPVYGADLREVRHALAKEDATTHTRPLSAAEAEEIVRAAREKKSKPLPFNPLRPAQVPAPPGAQRDKPPIPREEPFAAARRKEREAMKEAVKAVRIPPPPRAPLATPMGDDDAPTTFFRGRPKVPSVAEMLGDEDEIGDGAPHATDPAPPPDATPLPLPFPRPPRRRG